MPDSPDPSTGEIPEPVRMADLDLADLSASVRRLIDQSQEQARVLDHLAADPPPILLPGPDFTGFDPGPGPAGGGEPLFIMAMEGQAYESELDALTDWVDDLLLPVYGREITSSAPWCPWWDQHPEAVARLHALWLAWQQHIGPEAGPSGPSTWHRDHLDHTMAQLRAPNGPFVACTTNPARPAHRLLPGPKPTTEPVPTTGHTPAA
ncbi:DUF4913 domain-containing protein [Streptomyces nondiastaticus]|uniref:DUF4913 domain-containing protein n=1 Tax=Streptomyces nondiastaticus TaxID=3154512 RepID=A0ABW6TRR2_9ACTN